MKKIIAILMAALMVASLAGCAGKQAAQDDDICPGRQPELCRPLGTAWIPGCYQFPTVQGAFRGQALEPS